MSAAIRTVVRALTGALLGVLALAVLPAAPAAAHAALVSSSPAQGDRLRVLPAEVTFEFNQDMSAPAYVIVTAPDGSSVTDGDPEVDGAVVRQAVSEGPEGTYTMAYRVVSEDGHPVTGEIAFTVGDGGPDPTGTPSAAAPSEATPEAGGPARSTADPAPGQGDSFARRHVVAIAVGAALFSAALLLLLLARRTEP
ncbi:copper resistance protein CopC [Nocardioides sp. LMS-CY]|uniref:CopC domain-containing protein n=1 Tax=Nocardioides soli TaxID=1036020 RepID=A0A7W4Z3F0_9ACTN|nr:copper resistance CopC family protein [Nocardioides sp. LMS-CY]MBB3043801.1 hypothetical protein [Nocardioides soli]QWF20762.1 copper resistance protein CopC [Nocardioides sp. LMS-CY]